MRPAQTILIVTSGALSRHPRALKEATALGQAGFAVTVLTVENHASSAAYDRELLRDAPFRRVTLDHLARRGLPAWRSAASRLGTRLARSAVRFGIESPQALGPARQLGRMARDLPADLTIVHTEMPFWIGCELLGRGRRVAADFEDWHSRDLLPEARTARPMRLIARLERTLLTGGAYASTTSAAMARALQAASGGAAPVVITNSFPLQPPPPPRPADALPSLFWFSQTIGPGRGLESFLAAWARTAQPSRLVLLGEVASDYRSGLVRSLPAERGARLEFLPLVAPDKLPAAIARHDLGLALELDSPANKDLTISNKILQYLNAGLGVIASETAGQREVLERSPGAGILVPLAQTEALAGQLDALLADRARIAAMGRAARRAAEATYCWEREAPRLVAAVAAALQSPPPACG
jgi:glycosyltransferase involved in cell wall biosynthesis